MQAVILAAGRSTRTYPLTATRPKPLIPIWDRPLLGHQLRQLAGIVDEAVIVVGYRREQIEAYFGDEHAGVRLRYVAQHAQRGTADAVLAARPFVTARTLILNGDDFYLHDDLRNLAEGGRGLLVTRAPDPENRAVVRVDDGAITDIIEKPSAPPKDALCSVGGYALEASDLSLLDDLPLSPRGELELPDFVLRLARKFTVRPVHIGAWWLPITYAWDVLTAIHHIWAQPERARDLGIVEETHEALRARGDVTWGEEVSLQGPIRFGRSVHLGKGVRLVGPSCIGDGCIFEKGAIVERSAVFDETRIGARARIQDSVLGAGVHVGARGELESRPPGELDVEVKGKRVVPGLSRLGSVVGDGVHVAEGRVLPAGSLLSANLSTSK